MTDVYASFPPSGASGTITKYPTFADFPSAAVAGNGALALALDADVLYVSNGVTWVAIGGGGAALSIGVFDSGVASANGAHIDTNALIMQSASPTVPGLVNTTAQTFVGVKTLSSAPILSSLTASTALVLNSSKAVTSSTTTDVELSYVNGVTSAIQTQLNGKQATLTPGSISTSTTGVTVGSGANSTVGPNVTVNIATASTTLTGLLTSTDWNTFNNKQAALTPGNISTSTTGVTIGSGTAATVGPNVTVDIATASTTLTGLLTSTDWNTFNNKQAAGSYITALTGDVTATGPGSVAATIASIQGTTVSGTTGTGNVVFSSSPTLVTPALGTPTAIVLTSATGLPLTTGVTGTLPIGNGGTNSATALNNNRVMQSSGGAIVEAAAITASRALASDVNGIPVASATTATELGYVNGVTSAIQTQINGKQATLTIGNLTDVGTDGITVTGGTGAVIGSGTSLAQQKADATHNGYLSSTDWSTFNAGGAGITALTGDVTATGPGSAAATVAKIQGTTVSGTTGTVNVVFSNSPTLVTPNLGTPSTLVLTNATGLVLTTGVTGVLPLANGGTNKNMTAVNGGIVWTDADSMEVTAAGTSGQLLMSAGAAAPTWVDTITTPKTFSASTTPLAITTATNDVTALTVTKTNGTAMTSQYTPLASLTSGTATNDAVMLRFASTGVFANIGIEKGSTDFVLQQDISGTPVVALRASALGVVTFPQGFRADNDTAAGGLSIFNYYREYEDTSTNDLVVAAGGGTVSAVTIHTRVIRVGMSVTATYRVIFTADAASTITSLYSRGSTGSGVPSWARPPDAVAFGVGVDYLGGFTTGQINARVDSNGDIVFQRSLADVVTAWTASTTFRIGFSGSWCMDI